MNVCLRCPCPKIVGLSITRAKEIDNLRRGDGTARPTLPRCPEANREDDALKAVQEELDVERLGVLSAQPLPATRGATRVDNPADNLYQPRTPVDNPHDAMSATEPARKRRCRLTKWGTPSEKHLNDSRKCVVSRAYKAAVKEARKSGATAEDAARAGREAFAVAGAAYEKAMAGP